MNPKKIPFTDAYVKEQQSTLTLGVYVFVTLAIMAIVAAIAVDFMFKAEPIGLITLGIILLLWAALSKTRLNTFRENLELSKMIQQLRSAPEPGKGAKE